MHTIAVHTIVSPAMPSQESMGPLWNSRTRELAEEVAAEVERERELDAAEPAWEWAALSPVLAAHTSGTKAAGEEEEEEERMASGAKAAAHLSRGIALPTCAQAHAADYTPSVGVGGCSAARGRDRACFNSREQAVLCHVSRECAFLQHALTQTPHARTRTVFDMTSTSSVHEEEFYQRICNESRERERERLRERGGVGGVGGRAVPGGGLLEGGGGSQSGVSFANSSDSSVSLSNSSVSFADSSGVSFARFERANEGNPCGVINQSLMQSCVYMSLASPDVSAIARGATQIRQGGRRKERQEGREEGSDRIRVSANFGAGQTYREASIIELSSHHECE
jgi:hypothetical protein